MMMLATLLIAAWRGPVSRLQAEAAMIPALESLQVMAASDGRQSISRRRFFLLPLLTGAPAAAFALPEQRPVRVFDLMTAVAGPGGPRLNPAEAQLGRLAASLAQLNRLIEDLSDPNFKPSNDDSMVVLRLSAIYFKSSPSLMSLTAEFMEQGLSADDLARCATLTAAFNASINALEDGCRQQDAAVQLASAREAATQLTSYLEVAGHGYAVPDVQMPYSSFRP